MSDINGSDPHDDLLMNVTAPILSHTDMGSSESNALQEGADVQRYELAHNWTDAFVAVTPPEGFTTQELAFRLASISALDATQSSAQTLVIISALLIAITFTGGTPLPYYPRPDQLTTANYPAPNYVASPAELKFTSRFIFAIVLVKTSAFSCALFSVICNLYSVIGVQVALIVHHHNTDNPPQYVLEDSAPLKEYRGNRKWLLKHMSVLTLLSVFLLLIAEAMNLVALHSA